MSKRGGKKGERVRAAGGLVVREGPDGPEVAVVHRPRYDDWSLPKGKLESGESFKQGALREVEEETGLRCRIERELEPNEYRDGKGRRKEVRWFAMTPKKGHFEINDEVDELRWLPAPEAIEQVDYDHDKGLIATLLDFS